MFDLVDSPLLDEPRPAAVVKVQVRDGPEDGEEDGPIARWEARCPSEERAGYAGVFE